MAVSDLGEARRSAIDLSGLRMQLSEIGGCIYAKIQDTSMIMSCWILERQTLTCATFAP